MRGQLTALIILDGYGYTPHTEGNAILKAPTPFLDFFRGTQPTVLIDASGEAVGLPEGQMGNSEVGHLNLGAGRVVYQELTRITKAIRTGEFFNNTVLRQAMAQAKVNNGALHLMGLVSDGGVHSSMTHLFGLLEMAKQNGLQDVYVHCYMDGRDTPPTSGAGYLAQLEAKMTELGIGEIATISGRYYAMDRDNRWERIEQAYNALVNGTGRLAETATAAMAAAYANGETDEFVVPTIVQTNKNSRIKENDAVIFFNFRPDRARQLTRVFTEKGFNAFNRNGGFVPVHFVTMTNYDATLTNVAVVYPPQTVDNTLGEYLSSLGVRQLRIAETEKYAHVTYFFNGGIEKIYDGEDRILVPSPKVATYDLKPEMSAYEVTEEVLKAVESDRYKLIVLNYANPDMVGHTGIEEAAEKAITTVDRCTSKVIEAILKKGGNVILTADHGNAEKMIDYETKKTWTAHTTNQVQCTVAGLGAVTLREGGSLADIAPTILDLLDINVPAEMTGKSLIR